MQNLRRVSVISSVLLAISTVCSQAFAAPTIQQDLASGNLDAAIETLTAHLDDSPDDDLARFQLGTIQIFRAVEKLAQDGNRYGVLSNGIAFPFVRVGGFGGKNPNPEPVTYHDVREMIARFQTAIANAEQTLSSIEATDLSWDLEFDQVALDLNGDGQYQPRENLKRVFRSIAGIRGQFEVKQPLIVGFDSADVYWLHGYCHVLQALADMTLAYDHQRLFDLTAHAFFANPQTDYTRKRDDEFEHSKRTAAHIWRGWEGFADVIAAIHLMDFKLIEPRRMESARKHMLSMIELSRRSWNSIEQESDNHHEWIPGPNQKSVIPRLQAGEEQIAAWREFLTEAEQILNGEKLVPFWRTGFADGVNVRRVFSEPRDFDLILWLQGSAALPYLEPGEQTDPDFWTRLQRTFRGQFLGFALWTN